MHALIVEDDPTTTVMLEGMVRRQGWTACTAADLEGAWTVLRDGPVDIVLLDLSLPDGDGLDLLRRIRRGDAGNLPDPKVPVLVISSRSQLRTRLSALDLGADGYVMKPMHLEEVAAVMRALWRRRSALTAGPLVHRDISLDPQSRSVLRGGHPVTLSDPEFAVLLALLEERPRALTRSDIQARSGNRVGDVGTVDVHVHHLRRKLGESLIQTVRGIGYRVPPPPAA